MPKKIAIITALIVTLTGGFLTVMGIMPYFTPVEIEITSQEVRATSWLKLSQYWIEVTPITGPNSTNKCNVFYTLEPWYGFLPSKSQMSINFSGVKEMCKPRLDGVKEAKVEVSIAAEPWLIGKTRYYKASKEIRFVE